MLLLSRRRAAAPVFMLSMLAYLLSLFHGFFLSSGREVMGDAFLMQAVVLAGCLFFAFYSRTMARKGVLK